MAKAQKAAGATKRAEPDDFAWEMLHAGYLKLPNVERVHDGEVNPRVRELARRLGIRPEDARQKAYGGSWELERLAIYAREWLAEHGYGAKTEEEFSERQAKEHFSHLMGTPEGDAYARAIGREIWLRVMGPLLEWEAHQELARAKDAHLDAESRRRDLAAFEASIRGRSRS